MKNLNSTSTTAVVFDSLKQNFSTFQFFFTSKSKMFPNFQLFYRRVMEIDRHSLVAEANPDDTISIDEHDFVPHFQRVSISGEDTSGVPLEDLEKASHLLIQALELRERYMSMSHQSFPHTAGRFVRLRQEKDANVVHHDDKKTIAGELSKVFIICPSRSFAQLFSLNSSND
jgi:AMP deaminase